MASVGRLPPCCWPRALKVVGVSGMLLDPELPGLEHVLADMTEEPTPSLVAEHALSSFGHIDVLVNKRGHGRAFRTGYMDVTDRQWRDSLELLFLSVVRMTNSALPSLLASGSGVRSTLELQRSVPVPSVPDYAAAKAALTPTRVSAGQYASKAYGS